jgi:IS4 transposase
MTNVIGERGPVAGEFTGSGLGDQRLDERLVKIAKRLEDRPDAGFPEAMVTEAETEAFYRFVRNPKATFEAVLGPHIHATRVRCSEVPVVLAVHDSSEFRFTGSEHREGLGCLGQSGQGFLGHFTLAVAPGEMRDPLGVLHVEKLVRQKGKTTKTQLVRRQKVAHSALKDVETEQMRWHRGVSASVEAAGKASQKLVHVMDSEADDYSVLSHLTSLNQRFVVRMHYDRVLAPDETGERNLIDAINGKPVVARREVQLARRGRHAGGNSRKRNPQRDEREAVLEVRVAKLTLRRPNSASRSLPPTLPINVVHVLECGNPVGTVPVEWILATTEPIATKAQILAVVDYYRSRWVIEEFFKALKTGCAFEKRQLESAQTLYVALALLVPVAWRLLRLRVLGRLKPEAPARLALGAVELQVLRGVVKSLLSRDMAKNPTVGEVMLAVAKLGGHLQRNGPPGWLVLSRGFMRLQDYVSGYLIARDVTNP